MQYCVFGLVNISVPSVCPLFWWAEDNFPPQRTKINDSIKSSSDIWTFLLESVRLIRLDFCRSVFSRPVIRFRCHYVPINNVFIRHVDLILLFSLSDKTGKSGRLLPPTGTQSKGFLLFISLMLS